MQGIFSVDMLGLHIFMQIIGKLKKKKKNHVIVVLFPLI